MSAALKMTSPPEAVLLEIGDLTTEFGTQMRPGLDERRVEELAELLADGEGLDPIKVVRTPRMHIVTDGFHRIAAHSTIGCEVIYAVVKDGTEADAVKEAAAANAIGPLPRCPKTKRNAVLALLDLPEFEAASVKALARAAKVSERLAKGVVEEWTARRERQAEASGETYERPATVTTSNGKHYPRTVKPEPEPQDDAIPNYADESDDDPTEPGIPRTPEPDAEETDPAEKKASDDEEWLQGLRRDNGREPTRDRLSDRCREVFDREALRYRTIQASPSAVNGLSVVRTAIGDRRLGSGDGPFSAEWSRALNVNHPRDWPICFACKGQGIREGSKCGDCQAWGFRLR